MPVSKNSECVKEDDPQRLFLQVRTATRLDERDAMGEELLVTAFANGTIIVKTTWNGRRHGGWITQTFTELPAYGIFRNDPQIMEEIANSTEGEARAAHASMVERVTCALQQVGGS